MNSPTLLHRLTHLIRRVFPFLSLAILPGQAAAQTLYWGGGSSDITGPLALPANAVNGTWDATIQNWASDPVGDGYQAWASGAAAAFGTANAVLALSLGADIEVSSIQLNAATGTGTTNTTLSSVDPQMLTLTGPTPTFDIGRSGSAANLAFSPTSGRFVFGNGITLAGSNGFIKTGRGGLNFGTTAERVDHPISGKVKIIGTSGPGGSNTTSGFVRLNNGSLLNISEFDITMGGRLILWRTSDLISEDAVVSLSNDSYFSWEAEVPADPPNPVTTQTIDTLRVFNDFGRFQFLATDSGAPTTGMGTADSLLQIETLDRGEAGVIMTEMLGSFNGRIQINNFPGEPNVSIPWMLNRPQSGAAQNNQLKFVRYNTDEANAGVGQKLELVPGSLAAADVSTWSGLYDASTDLFFTNTSSAKFAGALSSDQTIRTLAMTSTANSAGTNNLDLGANTLFTRAVAMSASSGTANRINNGYVAAAPGPEDAAKQLCLYLVGSDSSAFGTAQIGSSGDEASRTFDVILNTYHGLTFTFSNSNDYNYIGDTYVHGNGNGTISFQGTGRKVTGDLFVGAGAAFQTTNGAQFNLSPNTVVTLGEGSRFRMSGTTGTPNAALEKIRGLVGTGQMEVGILYSAELEIDTDGNDYVFDGRLSGAVTSSGASAYVFSIIKSGLGTQTFAGLIDHELRTDVRGGTLRIAGSHTSTHPTRGYRALAGGNLQIDGDISVPGGVTVFADGALSGVGEISTTGSVMVDVGGLLLPGTAEEPIGKETLEITSGNLVLESTSETRFSELRFRVGPEGYTSLDADVISAVGDDVKIVLEQLEGDLELGETVLQLLSWNSKDPGVPNLNSLLEVPEDGNGYTWDTSTFNDNGQVKVTFVLTEIAITSEPDDAVKDETEEAIFSVSANGGGIRYQWQFSPTGAEGSFEDIIGESKRTLSRIVSTTTVGFYRVLLENNFPSTATSAIAQLSVLPLAFTDEPDDLVVDAGAVAQFVATTSSVTATLQWQYRSTPLATWEDIDDEISTLLEIPFTTQVHVGQYRAILTRVIGMDTEVLESVPAALTLTPVAFTTQPQSTLANPGDPAAFSAAVSGGLIQYQWQFRRFLGAWQEIVGATTNTLPVPAVGINEMGEYRVLAQRTGDSEGLISDVVGLSLISQVPIQFVTQPVNALALNGASAVFTATVTGSDPIFVWQVKPLLGGTWTSAGTGVINTSGNQATSSLSAVADINNPRLYRVIVSNSTNTATSNVVTLQIGENFEPVLAGTPPQNSDDLFVLAGDPFSLEAVFNGFANSYLWIRNGAIGKPVAVVSIPSLTVAAASRNNAGNYQVVAVGTGTPALSGTIQVGVVTAPQRRVVAKGGATVRFSVRVDGRSDAKFTWFRDGVALSDGIQGSGAFVGGAATAALSIAGVSAEDSAEYFCRVSNADDTGAANGGIQILAVATEAPKIDQQPLGGIDSDNSTSLTLSIPDGGQVSAAYSFAIPMQTGAGIGEATSFAARGLHSGLKMNSVTGTIEGIPNAGGTRNVTITASNAAGRSVVVVSLTVEALDPNLVGTFSGLVERSVDLNGELGGRWDAVVRANGAFSLTLRMGASTFRGRGRLDADTLVPTQPVVEFNVSRGRNLTALTIRYELDADSNRVIGGSVGDGVNVAVLGGWRNVWSRTNRADDPANNYAGYHTATLELADEDDVGDLALPQGYGFFGFTVNPTTGRASLSGRLTDGTPVTTATFAGPEGEFYLWRFMYASTVRGSVLGNFQIDQDDMATANRISGDATWTRPATISGGNRLYRDGFGKEVPLLIEGGRYTPPPAGTRILGLEEGDQGRLSFAYANLETALPLVGAGPDSQPSLFTLDTRNRFGFDAPNERGARGSVVARTGLWKASIRLATTVQPIIRRTINAQGILIPGNFGGGYSIVPQLPVGGQTIRNSPQLSAEVIIQSD